MMSARAATPIAVAIRAAASRRDKPAAVKVVKEIGCCENDGLSAKVAEPSCCAATNANS